MKNIILIDTDGEQLISSIDDGTNSLYINGTEVDSSNWIGTGNYVTTVGGHTITIAKVADLNGNVMIQKVSEYNYKLTSLSLLYPVYQDQNGNIIVTGDLTVNEQILSDWVIETGTSNSFNYRKWSDGRLEAERIWNIGQVTLSTTETSTTKVSNEVTIPTPSIMTSGEVEVTYVGNSSNSAVYLERITRKSFRLAKNTTANVTTQGNTVVLRVVNGRWK